MEKETLLVQKRTGRAFFVLHNLSNIVLQTEKVKKCYRAYVL